MENTYIKQIAQQIVEGKYAYDKKSAQMKHDNSDPDQRHGLFVDGKLVKTYASKEQADNVKARDPKYHNATVKKIAEGSMGGINRCAPSNDVSYEDVLNDVYDKWHGQKTKVTELSVDTMQKYKKSVDEINPLKTDKYKLVQHQRGNAAAGKKIATKTGDRTKAYESKLAEYVKQIIK